MSTFRPPGQLISGPHQQHTSSNGGVRIEVRSRGPGTYILIYSNSSNSGGGGVACASGEVGAVVGGRVVRKSRFGAGGSCGRPFPNTVVFHLDANKNCESFIVDAYTQTPNRNVWVSLWTAPLGTRLPSGPGWLPGDWYNHNG